MCILCEIAAAVQEEAGEVRGERHATASKVLVGTISTELLEDFRLYNKDEKLRFGKIEIKTLQVRQEHTEKGLSDEELRKRAQELTDQTEQNLRELQAQHDNLWSRVYEELNIPEEDQGEEFLLKAETGEIFHKVEAPVADGVQ